MNTMIAHHHKKRPVRVSYINDHQKRVSFDGWFHKLASERRLIQEKVLTNPCAVVEGEDGHLVMVPIDAVQFLDPKGPLDNTFSLLLMPTTEITLSQVTTHCSLQ